MRRVQQLGWPTILAGLAVLAGYSYSERPSAAAHSENPSGWDELTLCSELTSIDSKKSLSLSSDLKAKLTEQSDRGRPKITEGRWTLLDAERHTYQIDIVGASGVYSVVSPPDAEGCILALGGADYTDLRRSWFSVHSDAAEPQDPP